MFWFDHTSDFTLYMKSFFKNIKFFIMKFPKLSTAKVLTKKQAKEIFGGTTEPDGCTQCRVCVTSKKGDTIINN